MAQINNHVIGFTKEDGRRLHHPHNDVLVVSIQVRDYNTHRVLVDNGSSIDILYYPTFQQIRIDRERLIPVNAPLVGFGGIKIKLDKADQKKTSFVTIQGLFCCNVMSFGLKNARATYQRLMNKMFAHQIGRNVQVYMDNMLVKSLQEDDHLNDPPRDL
ncbi:uncharacterized protein LOC115963586 [Quercus lobata]|uniref:uncharacterized protein LOC115963586 n=1 Tax=Quercus lobata TaxID=97700 RepID=UPI001245E995|nr:uncharacterized protein LOC115963586 [Quercus lobata]